MCKEETRLDFDKYDMLKYELFEQLIPDMLYTGSDKEREMFLEGLEDKAGNMAYCLFKRLCDEDKVLCPYDKEDFSMDWFEEGGVHFTEITVPEASPEINYVLRAYVVKTYERQNSNKKHFRYFVVKRFHDNGMIHVLYFSPENEWLLGEELTNHVEDKEYEHRSVARSFIIILMNELDFGGTEIKNIED